MFLQELSEIKKVVGSDRAIVPSIASGNTLEKVKVKINFISVYNNSFLLTL